jgi:SsrA-binding protein
MSKNTQTKGRSDGMIAENRRSRRDYEVEDTLEAGIMLTGSEVKSLREGKANIAEAYVSPEQGELWLINCEIQAYKGANRFNHEPRRKRKLLVSRRELSKLSQEVERAGRTIVPLKFYFNDRGIAKLLIGTATGRKNYDKRNVEAKRDWDRQKARILKEG